MSASGKFTNCRAAPVDASPSSPAPFSPVNLATGDGWNQEDLSIWSADQATGGARLALARDALGDIDAILQPGLTALRNIQARGQDTTAPALALWREFHALRSSLLVLARIDQEEQTPVGA